MIGIVFIGGLVMAPTVTAAHTSKTSVCQGVDIATGGAGTGAGCSNRGESLKSIIAGILNVLSLMAGFIAVVMIIVGGFRYVVSGGNDNAVAGAKNTIIYALVGVIVLALAQAIVHFVLGESGL